MIDREREVECRRVAVDEDAFVGVIVDRAREDRDADTVAVERNGHAEDRAGNVEIGQRDVVGAGEAEDRGAAGLVGAIYDGRVPGPGRTLDHEALARRIAGPAVARSEDDIPQCDVMAGVAAHGCPRAQRGATEQRLWGRPPLYGRAV